VRECDNVPASNVHAFPALPSLYLLLVNLLLQDFAGKQCLFLGNNPPQIDQTTSLFAQTIEKIVNEETFSTYIYVVFR